MLMPLEPHLWRFAVHTGVQSCNTKALQHWSGQHSFPTVQCCSVKQPRSMLVPLHLHLGKLALHTGIVSATYSQEIVIFEVDKSL